MLKYTEKACDNPVFGCTLDINFNKGELEV